MLDFTEYTKIFIALLAQAHRMLDEQAGWSLTRNTESFLPAVRVALVTFHLGDGFGGILHIHFPYIFKLFRKRQI